MAINNTPAHAACTTVPDPEGRGTVLRVVYAHHLDGESLALKLYDRYARQQENGECLPAQITLIDLTGLLGEQGAYCAEGWHVSEHELTEAVWDEVWPWACAQVRRLFPDLSWSVEPGRRIVLPWGGEAGTPPDSGV